MRQKRSVLSFTFAHQALTSFIFSAKEAALPSFSLSSSSTDPLLDSAAADAHRTKIWMDYSIEQMLPLLQTDMVATTNQAEQKYARVHMVYSAWFFISKGFTRRPWTDSRMY